MRSGNKRGREEEGGDEEARRIRSRRRSLQAMFRGIQRYDLESVLETLRNHPELASESFAFANGRKAKPLSIVLRQSTVSLKVVQEIYKHFPVAASCGGIRIENRYDHVLEEALYPLFLACCQDDSDDEVVEFLAHNSDKDVVSPEYIPDDGRPIWMKREPTIVPYLRDLFVQGTKYTGMNSPANTPLLSLAKVKTLFRKFPQLLEFDGIKFHEHQSLLEDALKAGYSQEILTYIVSKMPEPKTLAIMSPTSYSSEQLDNFCWVLNNSPSLKKLTWITASPGGLSMMLPILGIGQEGETAPTNAITSLKLCFTKYGGDAEVLDVVEKLIQWGHLEELTLEAHLPEYDDEDEPKEKKEKKRKALESKLIGLCRLLRHDQKLQSLAMTPPWITTKKALQVLAKTMEQNTHLREASLASEPKLGKFPSFKRVQLYAKLNRGGRGLARQPATTIPTFVELLNDLPNRQTERGTNAREKELHSLVYLFLREAPGLWSKAWTETTA